MDKKEINLLLKKELEHLQDIPERGLQASHAGREKFLAQVKAMKPRAVEVNKPVRKGHRRSWALRMASVIAVLALALGGLGGTAYAAQASGPDDLLYGVKTLTEDIQLSLENDPEDRLDLITQFANRRLEEIQSMAAAGEPISEKALSRLEKHTQQMMQQAAQMGGGNIENALRQVQQSLELQNQVMTKLRKQDPGSGAPGLIKAQEEVQSRMRQVENGINEPQGFQEQMRIDNSDQPGNGNTGSPGQGEGGPGSQEGEGGPGSQEGEGMPGNGNGQGPAGK